MQSQNNPGLIKTVLNNLTLRQKQILGVAAAVLLVIIIIAGLQTTHQKPKAGDALSHVDKNSGETVHTIVGENESYGTGGAPLLFLGSAKLLTLGLSVSQVNAMKSSLLQYSTINSLGIKQVSVTVDSIKADASGLGTAEQMSFLTMPVIFDTKTTESMKIQYKGATDIEVFLYDKDGKQIFDSGIISNLTL